MSEIKDSGTRREFESGAVRDDNGNKGRCDLLPLDIVSDFLALQNFELEDKDARKTVLQLIDEARVKPYNYLHVTYKLFAAIRVFIAVDVEAIESSHVRPIEIVNGEEVPWVPLSDSCTAVLEVAHHFQGGAKKYGENNWQKGIPVHCYIDSAIRHYIKYLRGDADERHDRAFIWNIFCALWTMKHKPELNDYFC